jgi:glutamate/tyrosine decarboxylase-like PLP-dependent enzyme
MVDDMLDYIQNIRSRPVWRPMPEDKRAQFCSTLPQAPTDLSAVYEDFSTSIVPYALGNVHPGFMGWVHGGGTAVGMLAELLAAGLNANAGGRDHAAIAVERQIVEWMRQLFGFPQGANGIFVTGTSTANLLAVLIARTNGLGRSSRETGLGEQGARLRAYTSRAAHGCIVKAMETAGLGSHALTQIATDRLHRIDLDAVKRTVKSDRDRGLQPFLLVANAGTVDAGAIDDLRAAADFCRAEGLWFHVDGAFGAMAKMSPALAPRLAGIECADSIAFDFHKWAQVPYDAGFLLVRDGSKHLEAFASPAAYLRREMRGMAAGSPWPCDLGLDLSRGFRALKVWFTLKTFGSKQLGGVVERCCDLARYLEARAQAEPRLEVLAPAQLNIVCFRYRASDSFNAALAVAIQESGIAAPSTTVIDGRLAIRAAITNHRTQMRDIDAFIDATLSLAGRMPDEEAPETIKAASLG